MALTRVFGSRDSTGRRRNRRLFLEALELREMMAADINGTVYEDVDRNGIRNNGENGVAGWTVFLDTNRDGVLNAGESSAVTNIDGDYQFNSRPAGNYRVAIVMQTGWVATSPMSQDIVVGSSGNVRANFFVFSGGDIAGTIWNDLDHNGVRAVDTPSGAFLEPGLVDWQIFLDINNNRDFDTGEPSTLTDGDGKYFFLDLPPGDYEVFEIVPTNWEISPGFDNKQTAAVVSRQTYVSDFANYSLTNGAIIGTIYNDLDADGIRRTDPVTGAFLEPGLEGWTVYLDLNNNRVQEPSEPFAITDANGQYTFSSLLAGDYDVTEVLPPNWDVSPLHDNRQTVAVIGGETTTAPAFANFTTLNGSISGLVWNDLNRNGFRDVNALTGVFLDPPLAGWRVYVDLNRNGLLDPSEPNTLTNSAGQYSFLDMQVGEYHVREILPTGWEIAPTFDNLITVFVVSGVNTVAKDFANYDASASAPATVAGTVWNDLNGNGLREATDVGLPGWTVFLDSNNDGLLTTGETSIPSTSDGSYSFSGVTVGTVNIVVLPMVGWIATSPITNRRSIVLRGAENATGLDFGETRLKVSSISGFVFADNNKDGVREAGERGLSGITAYLDLNNNNALDVGEPSVQTSQDLFYTPSMDEAGSYSFTHLADGTYVVRHLVPAILSSTPTAELVHTIPLTTAEDRTGVNVAAVFRPNEIRGVKYDDLNGNHVRDPGEPGMPGITIFIDLNRNRLLDDGEPRTVSGSDGSYAFTNLSPGKYVIRSIDPDDHEHTYPTTVGGILWPPGISNPAVGNVDPTSITDSLLQGQSHRQSVSITLPNTGALTNLVDVFLLFDDTGSFVNNSPIVRAAFPAIMTQLQASLLGIDLAFGVGRFEEYGNFGAEYATGRPFALNQPIVAATTPGYQAAIQAALNRTTPGYGGDAPETDIEALYQVVTGRGFDGNNNGSVLDSGPAGLASTQLIPGNSGDVPPFASLTADPANSVLPAAGNIGGAGFRSGALPIILLATDTGFAYQPKGESIVTGANGVNIPLSQLTQASRPTTPFSSGAGIQETITGLNALGALVIGLGTNAVATIDPRQQLESISKLTGATNRTTTTIANGTVDPIAPGDPLYFQIATGFATSVSNGVVNAVQNAVTNVAVDIDVIASDPRVRLINHTGVLTSIGSGMTASFDIEIIGDGAPRRFDLQFVRAGTNVVLGSIPVVIGTPIPGDGYEYEDLDEGEIEIDDDFGSRHRSSTAPASVMERQVFYNHSTSTIFGDGTGNPINAIDTSKLALRPGQISSIANYTNYVQGLNGLIVDIANVAGTITSSDFEFATSNGSASLTFTPSTVTSTITTIPSGGVSNSTRFKIEFPDSAIRNTWLRVTVLANANTGLSSNDVFYFGNAVGDMNVGNIGTPVVVRTNATDTSAIRQNQSVGLNSVGITSLYDLNKDGRVNATDTSQVRQNISAAIFSNFTAPASLQLADAALASDWFDAGVPSLDEYFKKLGRSR